MMRGLGLALAALAILGMPALSGAKKKANKDEEPIVLKKRIEPFYPNWAYTHAIGEGFAKIAFYVDEEGNASEYFPIEYSHKAFADEFMKVLPKWKFEPAYRFGKPVKRVCRAHWEFLPDRPIVTNALFDTAKRIEKADAHNKRDLMYHNESELDAKPRMVAFPEVVAPADFDASKLKDGKIQVSCSFFVDKDGAVTLPVIMRVGAPELEQAMEDAFKQAAFERPLVDGEAAIAFLEKTYLINVTTP